MQSNIWVNPGAIASRRGKQRACWAKAPPELRLDICVLAGLWAVPQASRVPVSGQRCAGFDSPAAFSPRMWGWECMLTCGPVASLSA